MKKGSRYNKGKIRYDLLPNLAIEQLAKVLTNGSKKYDDKNWELGTPWSSVLASLKRHIASFEKGEDYDKESGLLHMAHAMCNTAFLTQYYKTYPEGDDRAHSYLKPKRIGLDIDDVIADFHGGLNKLFPKLKKNKPYDWKDPLMEKCFSKVKNDDNFWLNLKPLIKAKDLQFTPACYITSRKNDPSITQNWLDKNSFPLAPLKLVKGGVNCKVKAAKDLNIDWFVDDRYENFINLNNAGIFCFLFDQSWNKKYNVGFRRIKTLKELTY